MKKVLLKTGEELEVRDEYALRLEEQGQLKGFAPAKEAKAEAKAEEAPATEAKEAPKKKGK